MPKNFFEDMVRIKRERMENSPNNSIDSTPVRIQVAPTKKIPKIEESDYRDDNYDNKFASVYDTSMNGNNKNGAKRAMWMVAGVSVLFLLFALSYLFSGAKVLINPKMANIVVNESLSATKDGGDENLSFDLVVLSGEESKSISGGEEQDVFKRSKGTVIIYNNFSTAIQKLDIDTRLEGSNGKMYKTLTKTTVPGKSKTGTPGSVEVSIYASEPGAEYDSAPLDFKIFGFKGSPKYEKFYARSKDKITGGFKGKVKAVSELDKENALKELKDALKTKLFKKASDQIPAGFILFNDAGFLETEEVPPPATSTSDLVPVTLKGTFYGVLFDEQKITKKIAKDLVTGYDDTDVYIPDIQNLAFSLDNQQPSLKDIKNISFKLTGDTKIVWKVDTNEFMTAILGKAKKDFNQILSGYPNIESATLSIRPIWKMSFPNKEKNITIIVSEPK